MQIRKADGVDADRIIEILLQCFDEISLHIFAGRLDIAKDALMFYYSSLEGEHFLKESCLVAEERGDIVGVLAMFLPGKKIKKDSQVIPLRLLIKKAGLLKGIKMKIALKRADAAKEYPKSAYIDYFAVDPKRQGKRIGEKLLKAAEEYAEGEGYTSITLDALPGEGGAIKFYEKYGYKIIKKAKSRLDKYFLGVGEYWYMSKELK